MGEEPEAGREAESPEEATTPDHETADGGPGQDDAATDDASVDDDGPSTPEASAPASERDDAAETAAEDSEPADAAEDSEPVDAEADGPEDADTTEADETSAGDDPADANESTDGQDDPADANESTDGQDDAADTDETDDGDTGEDANAADTEEPDDGDADAGTDADADDVDDVDDTDADPTDAGAADDAPETDAGDAEDATAPEEPTGGLERVDTDSPERPPADVEPPASRTRSGEGDPEDEEAWDEFYAESPGTPEEGEVPQGPNPMHTPMPADPADAEMEEPPEEAAADDEFVSPVEEDGLDGPLETEVDEHREVPAPEGESDGGFVDADEGFVGPDHDIGGREADWDDEVHPPDDEEMPLADHIEEMVWRLGIVAVFGSVVTAGAYLGSEWAVLTIWNNVLPSADAPNPYLYGPLEKILTQIKVASLAGILVSLPMLVYQSYRFMRPGLYPHERRYYLAAVPTSLVLAAIGMAFSYLVVLPALFLYFLYYTEGSAEIAFGLQKTFDLVVTLTGFLAIVFQIPLLIMLAIMMGVTTRRWLADKRLYFWGGFLGVAFLFAPDPTGMAPIIVAITEVALFEGTLLLLKWTERR
jgi:sec-independent protein translocase protein TatC